MQRASVATLLLALMLVPQVSAQPDPPERFEGTYDSGDEAVALEWDSAPPSHTFRIERNGAVLVASTTATSHLDEDLPSGSDDILYTLYIVDSSNTASEGLDLTVKRDTNCEVLSISTSWTYPYAYANVHEECLP